MCIEFKELSFDMKKRKLAKRGPKFFNQKSYTWNKISVKFIIKNPFPSIFKLCLAGFFFRKIKIIYLSQLLKSDGRHTRCSQQDRYSCLVSIIIEPYVTKYELTVQKTESFRNFAKYWWNHHNPNDWTVMCQSVFSVNTLKMMFEDFK